MKIKHHEADFDNLEHVRNVFWAIEKYFHEYYLLNNVTSGKELRKQLKDLQLLSKIIYHDTLQTQKNRKKIKFKIEKRTKEVYSKFIKEKFYDNQ